MNWLRSQFILCRVNPFSEGGKTFWQSCLPLNFFYISPLSQYQCVITFLIRTGQGMILSWRERVWGWLYGQYKDNPWHVCPVQLELLLRVNPCINKSNRQVYITFDYHFELQLFFAIYSGTVRVIPNSNVHRMVSVCRGRGFIEPGEKLVITLRFLATGMSFKFLQYSFRIGHTTLSNCFHEVCLLWHLGLHRLRASSSSRSDESSPIPFL